MSITSEKSVHDPLLHENTWYRTNERNLIFNKSPNCGVYICISKGGYPEEDWGTERLGFGGIIIL